MLNEEPFDPNQILQVQQRKIKDPEQHYPEELKWRN
jgi:hypothetical protein